MVLLSSVGNTLPSKSISWHANWALVETEHLNMGHKVAMCPELPIMSWVLSDPRSHKVGLAQQLSIVKWKCYIYE